VEGARRRVHPAADDRARGGAYATGVTAETPTFASLEAARARQQATLRRLRPLGAVIVAIMLVAGSRSHPHPGLHGRGLAVLAALIVFTAAWVSTMRTRAAPPRVQAPLFLVLILSSAALVWLQPNGPGILGVFVAVGVATMRGRGPVGAIGAGVGLVAVVVAGVAVTNRSFLSIALSALGVTAFFMLSLFARRLREGQDQAERLLVELEGSRAAQARAAALAERQHLAREMHDVLAHSLSGLVLQLDGARLLAARERERVDPELADAIERAHRLARAGLEESRRAIGMLRGDDLPGPERLDTLAAEFERDSRIPCRVGVEGGERELGSEARLTVYRVAQEALTNVRKHAGAERVEVLLGYEPGGVRLLVDDFAAPGAERPAAPASDGGGYGLTGMRERAELLGGTLAAGPTEHGFRVELWVPA
jgi:signal transduction histidine kinase